MSMKQQNYHAREERFAYPIRAVRSLSADGNWMCPLWTEWFSQNVSLMNKPIEVAKLAAQGIIEEGKLLNQDTTAQQMADELLQCINNRGRLKECIIKLYTKETFLYKVLNDTLRNNDMSKVKTLGPLCFLINFYISRSQTLTEDKVIYRGMALTDEMIQEYSEAVGEHIDWPAFTSTTKNRAVAEMFGNTLCIITVCRGLFIHGADISSISSIPDEEEFLLSYAFVFRVVSVEIDPNKEKHLIYLKTIFEEE